eukprot:gene979-1155_t
MSKVVCVVAAVSVATTDAVSVMSRKIVPNNDDADSAGVKMADALVPDETATGQDPGTALGNGIDSATASAADADQAGAAVAGALTVPIPAPEPPAPATFPTGPAGANNANNNVAETITAAEVFGNAVSDTKNAESAGQAIADSAANTSAVLGDTHNADAAGEQASGAEPHDPNTYQTQEETDIFSDISEDHRVGDFMGQSVASAIAKEDGPTWVDDIHESQKDALDHTQESLGGDENRVQGTRAKAKADANPKVKSH